MAAFVGLQRIRDLCEAGWSYDAALDHVRKTTVFTTHTPVPAGHDAFPFHLVETHLAGAWGDLGGLREQFFALGHYDNGGGPMFNMTALAMRSSDAINAVSELHGEVTRDMFAPLWPDREPADLFKNSCLCHQRVAPMSPELWLSLPDVGAAPSRRALAVGPASGRCLANSIRAIERACTSSGPSARRSVRWWA